MAQSQHIPFAYKNGDLIGEKGRTFVPEPDNKEDKLKIWNEVCMFPFSIKKKTYAFSGPFDLPYFAFDKEVKEFFPSSAEEKILAFRESIRIDHVENASKAFRGIPLTSKETYLPWLNRMEKAKGDHWRKLGIFDFIQLSRHNIPHNYPLLLSSFCFWNSITNSFHLPYGMISPTLFDLAAILGLKPTGEKYTPMSRPRTQILPDCSKLVFKHFIKNNALTSGDVTDKEHVAFLITWLSAFVFCTKSLQVPKFLLNLANLLHEGTEICLAKLLLGDLYCVIGRTANLIRQNKVVANLAGPYWLLQLWLNAIFEDKLSSSAPSDISTTIEAYRLSYLAHSQQSQKNALESFKHYFTLFYQIETHSPNLAPFAPRLRGPTWFRAPLITTSDLQDQTSQIWQEFLSNQLLYASYNQKDLCIEPFQPVNVARQFGLSQNIPIPMVAYKADAFCRNEAVDLENLRKLIKLFEKKRPKFHPFKFELSHYCTVQFQEWWDNYYSSIKVPLEECLNRMTTEVVYVEDQKRRRKGITKYFYLVLLIF